MLKTNAAVWFKKACKICQLTPRYINIKVNGKRSQQTVNTIKAATVNRNLNFSIR